MYIADLVKKYEKYGIDRRTIDYYSSEDVKLIPCEKEEGKLGYGKKKSGKRVYDEKSEEVIMKMIILRDLGFSSQKIRKFIADKKYFTTATWNEHISELEKKRDELEEMIKYAKDMRDSNALQLKMKNLNLAEDIPLEAKYAARRIVTHLMANATNYIIDPNNLMAKSMELSGDIRNFINCCAVFMQLMTEKKKQQIPSDSDEVQKITGQFINSLEDFYGIALYLLYSSVREIETSTLKLSESNAEMYEEIMEALGICAKWFKEAKTLKQIQKYDLFQETCKEEIRQFEADGKGTVDDLIDGIQVIANIPTEISAKEVDYFNEGFNMGFELASDEKADESPENHEYAKATVQFIVEAVKYYISNAKKTE